ncbi:tRNA (adenosine(37)-N6)-threonylcarbamoyltransferase complex transferase subunit TsaD [Candidatus Dojkabacteria bacterium CG_4_9_14_3_um_filter_150_Dojkabacteria_WS6_41_13]|uniref:tRNA N6-adenosine threonylcarbamoyltransferase n=1 Tax=Candidatus Dojkabacteria bacterium CG_4_10_14_0_2_um_filter_Dojkabacteria_WS6_41_15 TaxID=2014249 RepID=A0A2M7W370_9BACT|nr:MAG: tRNA (adenosine(37)-N6)-threonylcarbamoyltransferase complex transferase subunit TsaD [Candidatus Dojkabacteria bacterium CG_4_10_14_3_um_filter_Dojkabacteria_WS6_41_9]PJA15814.1 MAG: tRNA (adenosine(37)-N6)-threonylcarbamoyltransferase complex transferase subunit TsaD [Candidatus Dojkabacteria bacterium CG_4_10_14_0_2_um_filter_Dojkabacteria_WS6_41_15]PJB22604.1 MAG: tRNA (adenosine(37)-N6)-threonylcarbamoyltransferase complex transferase subunit TsaD [Candidatus Dojkabacteria bacterium 
MKRQKDLSVNILGIETTCDETSLALVQDGTKIIHEVTMSQVAKHAPYGGVVPELGAREHVKNIEQLGGKFFEDIKGNTISAIAVASKVGLPPAVQVGESYAHALAQALQVPLIPINHVVAHVCGIWVDDSFIVKPTFPFLGLIVSGGHTQLIDFSSPTEFDILGETLDDAIGEAFDKVASVLGLPYPGGPEIERVSEKGDSHAVTLPIPLEHDDSMNFSFAGLKTAVRTYVEKELPKQHETYKEFFVADVAASFQRVAFTHIAQKAEKALKQTGYKQLVVGGGVASSQRLTDILFSYFEEKEIKVELFVPNRKYCTDNASVIAGYASNLLEQE